MKFLKVFGLVSSFVAPSLAAVTPGVKPMDKTGKVLERAAQLLEEKGWVQGLFHTHDGRMCAGYAIKRASEELSYFRPGHYENQAIARMKKYVTGNRCAIATWNDVYIHSSKQAVAGLRKASQLN